MASVGLGPTKNDPSGVIFYYILLFNADRLDRARIHSLVNFVFKRGIISHFLDLAFAIIQLKDFRANGFALAAANAKFLVYFWFHIGWLIGYIRNYDYILAFGGIWGKFVWQKFVILL